MEPIYLRYHSRPLELSRAVRGFTLVELLVVIAIIGVLSTVVLASLSTARTKGSDAAIQSDLQTIQTQAELFYYSHGNSYGTQNFVSGSASSCNAAGSMFADPTIARALANADSANGAGNDVDCEANGSSYTVAAEFSTGAGYFCVDSSGSATIHGTAMIQPPLFTNVAFALSNPNQLPTSSFLPTCP